MVLVSSYKYGTIEVMRGSFKTQKGFTLTEMLVVIAIISMLAAVVMTSITEARVNARDKTRISDLEQIKAAMHIYATTNGTYHIPGAGSGGQGWFSFKNGTSYPKSIAEELVVLGLLTTVMSDPLVPAGSFSAGTHRQYMNYFHSTGGATAGTCLFAQLENPSTEQRATMTKAPISSSLRTTLMNSYFMNYASCTQ